MKTSNTAIEQYIRCPRQFHEERHKKNRGTPNQGMLMGRVEHNTIERLLKDHKERGVADFLDIHEATDIFTQEWGKEDGLYDQDYFTQGLQQISDLIDALGQVAPERILTTEQWFSIDLGDDIEFVGVIDLVVGVEVVDEETGEVSLELEVIDWKTTKLFTSQHDAHESMQLSAYILAAKQLWPDATKITAALHMLDSGSHLQTKRSDKALAEDVLFIKAIAQQIDADESWKPRLNSDCVYCHVRKSCSAYRNALHGPMPDIVEGDDDLDSLAKEREAVHIREKLAGARKKEIDKVFKTLLKGSGQPIDLDDWFFRLSQVPRKSYPAAEACRLLSERLGIEFSEVVEAVCQVSNKHMETLFRNYEGEGDPRMAQAALANIQEVTYSSRLSPKKKKPNKKGKKP